MAYKCETCGFVADKPEEHCGAHMKEVPGDDTANTASDEKTDAPAE